jgi:hypothetical protein
MIFRQKNSYDIRPLPMSLQSLRPILRPRPAAQTSPPDAPNEPKKDSAMNIPSANGFDFTSDLYDIGVMAAASPEFADQLIRALLAAGESFEPPSEAAQR